MFFQIVIPQEHVPVNFFDTNRSIMISLTHFEIDLTILIYTHRPGEPRAADVALVRLLIHVQDLVDFERLQVLVGPVAVLADE